MKRVHCRDGLKAVFLYNSIHGNVHATIHIYAFTFNNIFTIKTPFAFSTGYFIKYFFRVIYNRVLETLHGGNTFLWLRSPKRLLVFS